jgi:allantoin racemase
LRACIKEAMTRLLLVNANTSQQVTDAVVAAARAAAAPGTEIVGATGRFGARIIATRSENAIAEHALLDAAASHAAGCDAVIVAVSYDTGLRAARELLPMPVVGMTEAALFTACMLGGRFGLVTFGRRALPLYRETVEGHGLAGRLVGLRGIEATALEVFRDPVAVDTQLLSAIADLVERDGAECIILAGAALAGWPKRLQEHTPVPLVDGIACAVPMAEHLVRLAPPKPRAGSYAAVTGRATTGLSDALAALLGKSDFPAPER